jgi:hypothetical protein
MSLDFKTYISEWLDLVNIMSYPYDKIKITGSERDNRGTIIKIKDDTCFEIEDMDECEQNKTCQPLIKESICISKTNLSNYLPYTSAIPNIFIPIGSNNSYEIIDAAEIITETTYLFYKIFKSNQTGIVYILFSTGRTIDLNTPEINNGLQKLIDKIKEYVKFEKIVIAGHSMGCMIALHFASILYKNQPYFFKEKCIVLGTGPYKGYHSQIILPNTKIFVLVYAYKQKLYIDDFFYEGKYKNYIPSLFINDTTQINNADYNEPDFLTKIDSEIQILARDNFHNLKKYKRTLQNLLNNNNFISYINNNNSDNTLTNTIIKNVYDDTNVAENTKNTNNSMISRLSNWLKGPKIGGKKQSKKNKSKKNKSRKNNKQNVLKRK